MNYATTLVCKVDYYNFTAPHCTTIFRTIKPIGLTIRQAQQHFKAKGWRQTTGRTPDDDGLLYWRFAKGNRSAIVFVEA